MAHAEAVGQQTLALLQGLSHGLIADVRGRGLFFAIELARDGNPAPEAAAQVVEKMRQRGFLIGRIGRSQHILKLRPPMPFAMSHAQMALQALQSCLDEVPV